MLSAVYLCGLACLALVHSVTSAGYAPYSASTSVCRTVTIFHDSNTYQDTSEFWESFNQELKAEQCSALQYAFKFACQRYINDSPYKMVYDYLRQACLYGMDNSDYLRTTVNSYCFYHKDDPSVGEAYSCSTSCRLADHLNQLCNDTATDLVYACPIGFELFNDTLSCYKVVTDPLLWIPAELSCRINGSDLVQINSQTENDHVQMLLMDAGVSPAAWIGLNDILTENEFVWSGSFDPVAYDNWVSSAPGTSRSTNCVELKVADGEWEDVDCMGTPAASVCEAPAFLV